MKKIHRIASEHPHGLLPGCLRVKAGHRPQPKPHPPRRLQAAAKRKRLPWRRTLPSPPYEFYENEKPAGIDVEIATAICEKLGYKLDIMDIEFGAILGAVSSGKADFTMAGLTVTDERKQSVDFSTSYATGIQSIVVKRRFPDHLC